MSHPPLDLYHPNNAIDDNPSTFAASIEPAKGNYWQGAFKGDQKVPV